MMTPTFTQEIVRQRHAEALRLADRKRLAAQVATDHEDLVSTAVRGLRKLGLGRKPAPRPHVAPSS